MRKTAAIILLVLLAACIFPGVVMGATSDPTQRVNRLRLVMSSTSDWTRLTVPPGDAVVASRGGVISGTAGNVVVGSDNFFMGGKSSGTTATVQYDLLLTTDGVSDGVWTITKGWGQQTHVDIYNINDVANPVLLTSVDDIAARGDAKTFIIGGSAESQAGPLSAGSMGPRKVFAWYAPWYTRSSWRLWPETVRTDAPTNPYDAGDGADVSGVIDQASAAGLDGFFASWQGTEGIGAYSDPKFRTLLSEADERQNFSVAVYLETRVANAAHSSSCLPDSSCQPDPAYIEQWLAYVVQNFGSSPAYLKMDKIMPDGQMRHVPVIVLYWAGDTHRDPSTNGDLSPNQWKTIFDNLHANGIDAFYIADSVDSTYLTAFDGLNSYNPAVFSNISYFASTRSVETKTYSLLADSAAQRKLWMGTVVPGEDTTKLSTPGIIVPRNNGAFYSSMWDTMLSVNPDWIMVTSWNEYNENTHIESSRNFGSAYLDLTRNYSALFKAASTGPVTISGASVVPFLPAGIEASWTTERDADSTIEYGTTSGVYTSSTSIQTPTASHRITVSGLQQGVYYARVKSVDLDGNEAVSDEFSVMVPAETPPRISIAQDRTYWADYSSYNARILTVDFRISNEDVYSTAALTILLAYGSSGVKCESVMPISVGDVGAGNSSIVSVRWSLPTGVGEFNTRLWAQAVTPSGTRVYYPEAPPA